MYPLLELGSPYALANITFVKIAISTYMHYPTFSNLPLLELMNPLLELIYPLLELNVSSARAWVSYD